MLVKLRNHCIERYITWIFFYLAQLSKSGGAKYSKLMGNEHNSGASVWLFISMVKVPKRYFTREETCKITDI